MNEGKTCLVTGGAGFIGSHLVDTLLAQGYRVVAVDNLSTGRKENLHTALESPNFHFLQLDASEPLPIEEPIHFIFHLASPASVPDYQRLPLETALVNSAGTGHLLELAKKNNARFLFASTSEVYGDPKEHPQKETYWGNVNPIGVRSCYDESKRFGEMLTMTYVRQFGLDGRIMRIFNTYGPRMRKDDGRVVSNFVNQALGGGPITIYGDGTQTRSLCYIDDLVGGIVKLMFADSLKGEVINLGNPEEFTVTDIAKRVGEAVGGNVPLERKPLPEDEPLQRRPDITKATKLLGWKPMVPFSSGLTKTIEYYRSEAAV